jgi:sec-independent protein translocase protein TatB
MFNIGISEFLIIAVVALILLGPDQLPDAVRSLAKVLRDVRRMGNSIKDSIDPDITDAARSLRSAINGEEEPAASPPRRLRDPGALAAAREAARAAPKPEPPAIGDAVKERPVADLQSPPAEAHTNGLADAADRPPAPREQAGEPRR